MYNYNTNFEIWIQFVNVSTISFSVIKVQKVYKYSPLLVTWQIMTYQMKIGASNFLFAHYSWKGSYEWKIGASKIFKDHGPTANYHTVVTNVDFTPQSIYTHTLGVLTWQRGWPWKNLLGFSWDSAVWPDPSCGVAGLPLWTMLCPARHTLHVYTCTINDRKLQKY